MFKLKILLLIICLLLNFVNSSNYLRTLIEDEIDNENIEVNSMNNKEFLSKLSWTISHDNIQNWYDITSSDIGKYVYAVVNEGFIHRSDDYGETWKISYDNSQAWLSISTNGDGKYIYAVASTFEGILVRSENHGIKWDIIDLPIAIAWLSVSCSGSGKYIYAVSYSKLYNSKDYGNNWSELYISSSPQFVYIAINKSGKHAYAATSNAFIYKSSHYGEDWVKGDLPIGDKAIVSLETSHTGKYVYVIGSYNKDNVIYKSSDYGHNYNIIYTTTQELWTIATNVNGRVIYIGSGFFLENKPGNLVVSYDHGESWHETKAGEHIWNGISTIVSGEIVYAVAYGEYIYKMS